MKRGDAMVKQLIMVLLLAGFLAGGCDRTTDDIEEDIKNAEDVGEWIDALAARPDNYEPPTVTSSNQLIEADYKNGTITLDQYYELKLTAALDHDNLDKEYKATFDNATDITSLLRLLSNDFDRLSEETRSKLQPYLLSFDDPQSAWYEEGHPTAEDVLQQRQALIKGPLPDMERPSILGEYFLVTGQAGTERQQEIVLGALQDSYDTFKDLGFPEPTDWIRVRVMDRPGGNNRNYDGVEYFQELLGRDRCHIDIKLSLATATMKATTAHELFHCFQEYMGDNFSLTSPAWVWESTAVWAEEFVYPTANEEHIRDAGHFSQLDWTLLSSNSLHDYNSYLFWFYYYQKNGKTGTQVKSMLGDIYENHNTAQTLMQRPDFYNEFKEYALWNFNQKPFKFFIDTDNEPTIRPFGSSVSHRRITGNTQDVDSVILPAGGIVLYVYTFGPLVDKVVFDLTEIQKDEDNHNGVQVIYEVDERFTYEDVSYRDELAFCRSRTSEEVSSVVFIISNGNLDESDNGSLLSASLPIDATGICVPEWRGYVDYTWSSSGSGDGRTDDMFILGNYESNGHTRVEEKLFFDSYEKEFYATEQYVTHSSHYSWMVEYAEPDTGGAGSWTAWEKKQETKQGSTLLTYDVPDDCPEFSCTGIPKAIKPYGDNETLYVHRTFNFRDLGTYTSKHEIMWVPQGLWLNEVEHTLNVSCPPDAMLLRMSDNGTRMYGEYSTESGIIIAEFTYE